MVIRGKSILQTRYGWVAALSLVAVLTLAPSRAAAEHSKIVTAFSGTDPHMAPLFVADVKGFFKKHGVDVRVRIFGFGAEAAAAFRTGRAELISACDTGIIALNDVEDDLVLLTPMEHDTDSIVISAREGINSISDLKGKKIAVPFKSAGELLAVRALESVGLGRKDVEFVNLRPGEAVPALVRGDVDAAGWWPPFNWQAEKVTGGKVKTLTTAKGFHRTNCLLAARSKYLERHPNETLAILRGISDAITWLREVPLEEKAAVVADYRKSDTQLTARILSFNTFDMTETPEYRETMKATAKFMLEAGLIKKPATFVWGSRYVRQLDPALVK